MRALWIGALALCTACAANPPPVPITGPAADVRALAGEWAGEYQSVETGRSGSIQFKLEAGSDTASGQVVMVPADIAGIRANPPGEVPPAMAGISQVLTIRFVRVSGNTITGTIDPYRSPDCACTLHTVFTGELRDNRIAGTFTSQHSGDDRNVQKGTWSVRRKVAP